MKKINACFILLLLIPFFKTIGQTAPDKYWVEFTDKDHSNYSVNKPHEFLSERAIDRRQRQGIPVATSDLPVSSVYTDSLKTLDIDVLYTSKWFNAATVYSTDTILMDTLHELSFVKNPVRTFSIEPKKADTTFKRTKRLFTDELQLNYDLHPLQFEMLNGDQLHAHGMRGEGMRIAVLDAGFYRADMLPAFDSIFQQDGIIATKNLVNDTISVYQTHTHGMKVLSVMAGIVPEKLMGTAPEAEYILIQSEDATSEYAIEGDNWIAAAEYADSLGADIINSSLGYATFDAPEQNYSYADMDGQTTRISIAADIASSKGILVVTSAGNQGNKGWKYITAPADADSVLTVGAVTPTGEYAFFSSVGPTFDGRVKPNVSAMGLGTFHQQADSNVFIGNGTSFSAPIISGLAACLWQQFPQATNMEIKHTIEESADLFPLSDSLMGYGIPDFHKAWLILRAKYDEDREITEKNVHAFPNPFSSLVYLEIKNAGIQDTTDATLRVYNLSSQKLLEKKILLQTGYNLLTIREMTNFTTGEYIITLEGNDIDEKVKVIKQ